MEPSSPLQQRHRTMEQYRQQLAMWYYVIALFLLVLLQRGFRPNPKPWKSVK
jgi:hypothetical protein